MTSTRSRKSKGRGAPALAVSGQRASGGSRCRGVMQSPVTPLKDDFSLDLATFEKVPDFHLRTGATAICGHITKPSRSTSRSWSHSSVSCTARCRGSGSCSDQSHAGLDWQLLIEVMTEAPRMRLGFQLVAGTEHLLSASTIGASGMISSLASIAPRQVRALYDACRGDKLWGHSCAAVAAEQTNVQEPPSKDRAFAGRSTPRLELSQRRRSRIHRTTSIIWRAK
jgi:hypothetical protein